MKYLATDKQAMSKFYEKTIAQSLLFDIVCIY